MRHQHSTNIHRVRALRLALTTALATGITLFAATHAAPSPEQPSPVRHVAVSAAPTAGDCAAYWTQAETLTDVPRDVQAGMNAIGYASAGAPQPQACPTTP